MINLWLEWTIYGYHIPFDCFKAIIKCEHITWIWYQSKFAAPYDHIAVQMIISFQLISLYEWNLILIYSAIKGYEEEIIVVQGNMFHPIIAFIQCNKKMILMKLWQHLAAIEVSTSIERRFTSIDDNKSRMMSGWKTSVKNGKWCPSILPFFYLFSPLANPSRFIVDLSLPHSWMW